MAIVLPSGARLERLAAEDALAQTWQGTAASGAPLLARVLRPQLGADPAVQARVRRERLVLLGLHNRHLVRWTEVVVGDGRIVLAWEEPAVPDLDAQLAAAGPLSAAAALRVASEVCLGLTAAHAAGLLHGDLWPGLVHLDGESVRRGGPRRARVVGVGVLALLRRALQAGGVPAEPSDAAPEVRAGGELSVAADLWSVGLLLARLLGSRAEPIAAPAPGVPEAAWALVRQLCAVEPRGRPASARQAATALAAAASRLAGGSAAGAPLVLPPLPQAPDTRESPPREPDRSPSPADAAVPEPAEPSEGLPEGLPGRRPDAGDTERAAAATRLPPAPRTPGAAAHAAPAPRRGRLLVWALLLALVLVAVAVVASGAASRLRSTLAPSARTPADEDPAVLAGAAPGSTDRAPDVAALRHLVGRNAPAPARLALQSAIVQSARLAGVPAA